MVTVYIGLLDIAGNSFIFYVNSDQYVLYLSVEYTNAYFCIIYRRIIIYFANQMRVISFE